MVFVIENIRVNEYLAGRYRIGLLEVGIEVLRLPSSGSLKDDKVLALLVEIGVEELRVPSSGSLKDDKVAVAALHVRASNLSAMAQGRRQSGFEGRGDPGFAVVHWKVTEE
jgi:hypothetical protein